MSVKILSNHPCARDRKLACSLLAALCIASLHAEGGGQTVRAGSDKRRCQRQQEPNEHGRRLRRYAKNRQSDDRGDV